jgi:hypothetical protein
MSSVLTLNRWRFRFRGGLEDALSFSEEEKLRLGGDGARVLKKRMQASSVNAIYTVSTLVLLLILFKPGEKSLLVSIYKKSIVVVLVEVVFVSSRRKTSSL